MSGFGAYRPPGSPPPPESTPEDFKEWAEDLLGVPKPNGAGDNSGDHADIGEPPNYPEEPAPPPRVGRIQTGEAFMASFVPPDWLIDGIVQKGRLYACTSLTGHGKTAVWLYNACMIQAGRNIGPHEVTHGNVLILAGENPEDLKGRMIGMAVTFDIEPYHMPYVLPGNFPLTPEEADFLIKEIEAWGCDFSLIIGDTAASFFPGEDENDNKQVLAYAQTLRSLTERVPGRPAVVVLSHPVKNARSKDDLLPRGGGAFLNELDCNLTLWSPARDEGTEMHWVGKIRGPEFNGLSYRFRTVDTGYRTKQDKPVMTVVADPQSPEEAREQGNRARRDEDVVLTALRDHPDSTQEQIAVDSGWVNEAGVPMKMKVNRIIRALATDKMVEQVRARDPWTLTAKGEAAIKGK